MQKLNNQWREYFLNFGIKWQSIKISSKSQNIKKIAHCSNELKILLARTTGTKNAFPEGPIFFLHLYAQPKQKAFSDNYQKQRKHHVPIRISKHPPLLYTYQVLENS